MKFLNSFILSLTLFLLPTLLLAGPKEISISDATILEGSSSTQNLIFTLTSTDNAAGSSIDYTTSDLTATTADSDYNAVTNTFTFPDNNHVQTISVTINGDLNIENNETFKVTLSNPTGVGITGIADAEGIGTILNDDFLVDLDISKTSSVAIVNQSSSMSYNLTVENLDTTNSAEEIIVTDTLPAGMGYVNSSGTGWSCTPVGSPVALTCTLATLAAQTSSTLTLNVTAADSNALGLVQFNNSATVVHQNDPDLTNNSSSVTVTLNRPPTAVNDTASTTSHTNVSGNVLTNDSDLDVDTLTIVSPGSYTINFGAITIAADGSWTYAPGYFSGETDSYTYTVSDGNGGTSTATLQISIGSACTDTGLIDSGRDFCLRKQTVVFGDMATIGNTVVVPPDPQPSSPNQETYCSGYSEGSFLDASSTDDNQELYLCSYKTDTYTNETSAELITSAGSTIKWAGLYLQSVVRESDTGALATMDIKIKNGSDAYVNAGSPTVVNHGFYQSTDSKDYDNYSAFIDVTSVLTSNGWTDGVYTVANVPVTTDSLYDTSEIGKYGAWSLIVIYEDTSLPLKSVSVYDGWKQITASNSETITVDNFYTPTSGSIDSEVSIFAAEGDKYRSGDIFEGEGTNLGGNNAFDSSISSAGTRVPSLVNNQGIDIKTYQIGTAGYNLLANGQNSITFSLSTVSPYDYFYPAMLSFSTEVYHPRMCYYEELYSGGALLSDGDLVAKGSQIRARVLLKNDQNEPAENVLLYKTFSGNFPYVVDSTMVNNNLNPTLLSSTSPVTDDLDGDIFDYSPAINLFSLHVGAGATFDTGGDFNNGQTALFDYNATANFDGNTSITYQIAYTMPTIGFRYEGELAKCVDFNSTFGTIPSTYSVTNADFDVVNNNYSPFYNLPTQITSRADNFTLLAFDPASPTTLMDINTTVAVELVDADSSATCSARTPLGDRKVWITFKDSSSASFTGSDILANIEYSASDPTRVNGDKVFYEKAAKNVAFRIGYPNSDLNGTISVVETPVGSGLYHLGNFTAIAGTPCVESFTGDKYLPNGTVTTAFYTQAPQSCANAGLPGASAMSQAEVNICMRCIYGNIPTDCSKDTFAIRPEAFMIKIDDQNQSLPTSQAEVSSPANLAAGYNYNIEVNATNHYTNVASSGYTKSFVAPDNAEFIFQPTAGCNDDTNRTTPSNFSDGIIDTNVSVDQVGIYTLNMLDTTWTAIDSTNYQTGADFTGSPDCVVNSSAVNTVASGITNGCNISSSHTNINAGTVYNHYNATFHPYEFDLTNINASVGLNNIPVTASSFVYMSDMSQDEEMSFHLNGVINAVGYTGSTMSNFVDNCYAKPINLTVNKSLADSNTVDVDYRYNFQNTDPAINDRNGSMNGSAGLINLATNDFNKSNSGSVNTILNLNFDRNITTFVNPEELLFSTYDANCTTPANCTMSVDLTTKSTDGSLDLNKTIKHYYGRSHASRQRYEGPTGTANIYYEAYCFGTIFGNTCKKNLLQNGVNSKRTDDIRWFINSNHNSNNDGVVGTVIEKGGTGAASDIVDATAVSNTNPETTALTYDESQGYPYKTTMENNASRWLIYNKYDSNATRNEFPVEFTNQGTWTGENETTTTTKDVGAVKSNRRIMW